MSRRSQEDKYEFDMQVSGGPMAGRSDCRGRVVRRTEPYRSLIWAYRGGICLQDAATSKWAQVRCRRRSAWFRRSTFRAFVTAIADAEGEHSPSDRSLQLRTYLR